MKTRILTIALPFALLAGCTAPETRLRTGLMGAGLSPTMAGCMADRMMNALSLIQLRRLQSLGSLKNAHLRKVSTTDFLHKVRALHDPEILAEATKAAGACALGM
jgi:hypothetical protein